MKRWSIVLLAPLLASCAASSLFSQPVHLANGWLAFDINCSTPLMIGIGSCRARAGEICPYGYVVLDPNDPVLTGLASADKTPSTLSSDDSGHLLIRCK